MNIPLINHYITFILCKAGQLCKRFYSEILLSFVMSKLYISVIKRVFEKTMPQIEKTNQICNQLQI